MHAGEWKIGCFENKWKSAMTEAGCVARDYEKSGQITPWKTFKTTLAPS